MRINSEMEYRYIIEYLDDIIDCMKRLRCDYMEGVAKGIPEFYNIGLLMRVEKMRNKVIEGFKSGGSKYPFYVEV